MCCFWLLIFILDWQLLNLAVPPVSLNLKTICQKYAHMGIIRLKEDPGTDVKQIVWMGRRKPDLKEFPERVQRSVGFALWGAQEGEMPPSSKA